MKRTVLLAGATAVVLACGAAFFATRAPTADIQVAGVSSWLIRDRPALVQIARTAKLAAICQSWVATVDHDALELALRDRARARNSVDRQYAAVAIREGETEALVDFKSDPKDTCTNLRFSQVQVAGDYLSGRKRLP